MWICECYFLRDEDYPLSRARSEDDNCDGFDINYSVRTCIEPYDRWKKYLTTAP